MCGRFTRITDLQTLLDALDVMCMEEFFRPRYNIAPSQNVWAVVRNPRGRVLRELRWGLVPHWAKDPAMGARMINARVETVAEKPAFREAFARRRCLIPADGFYEWRKNPDGSKTPMYIHRRDDQPFAFAGLYETWQDRGTGEAIDTCTILTTAAGSMMQAIHHRMPVILPHDRHDAWLDPALTDAQRVLPLVQSIGDDDLRADAVSRHVNSPAHDDARCIETVDDEPASPAQGELFA